MMIACSSGLGREGFASALGELAETLVPVGTGCGPDGGDAAAGTRYFKRFLDHGVGVVSLLMARPLSRCKGRV